MALRFDRLSPSNQLVLKIASVVGKDGAPFTAGIVSHLIKELSTTTSAYDKKHSSSNGKSPKNSARQSLTQLRAGSDSSSTIANLNSVNVEETLKKILGLNEFIKVMDRYPRYYSQKVADMGETRYKFKNVLIKTCIYNLMLNHQKIWSHQKVAEYLEAQAIQRVSELPYKSSDGDSDEDVEEGFNSLDLDPESIRTKEAVSVADWNMLGAHWRLSNNLIKAMACFYESGYLVDHQGDVETAKLLWTEAYEILCCMRKESSCLRALARASGLKEREKSEECVSGGSGGGSAGGEGGLGSFFSSIDDVIGSTESTTPLQTPLVTPRRLSVGSVGSVGTAGSKEESSIFIETSRHLSESVYHLFKGDSIALELAITLLIRLSQSTIMFEEQPQDVVNLNNEALELISCTRRCVLETDAIPFIHVPRLSSILFLRDSSLLGPVQGKKERRTSITLKDGKRLFCLKNPSTIFPVLSGMCMRYCGKLLPDDRNNSNWANICEVYLTTARDSGIPVHTIRALTLVALLHYVRDEHLESIKVTDEMDSMYVQSNHSEQIIHIYGADRAIQQYSFGALSCILLGDFRGGLAYTEKADGFLRKLNHIQSVVVTSTLQCIIYLLLHMYERGENKYNIFINYLSVNGGQHNMLNLYLPLFEELVRRFRLAENVPGIISSSQCSSSSSSSSSNSNSSSSTSLSGVDVDQEREDAEEDNNHRFNYMKLIDESRQFDSKDNVRLILALRYGKGVELLKAELCCLEAERVRAAVRAAKIYKEENENIYQFSLLSSEELRSSTDSNDCQRDNHDHNHNDNNLDIDLDLDPDSEGGVPIWRYFDSPAESCDFDIGLSEHSVQLKPLHTDIQRIRIGEMTVELAVQYCESGIRFLDYSLCFYPLHDSTLNSLQCFLVKADLLVLLARIQDENIEYHPNISSQNLHVMAVRCLSDALDAGKSSNIQLQYLLVGMRFVVLGLDQRRGEGMIKDFILSIINRDKNQNDIVIDINHVINNCSPEGEFAWMNSVPLLISAISLLSVCTAK